LQYEDQYVMLHSARVTMNGAFAWIFAQYREMFLKNPDTEDFDMIYLKVFECFT